MSATRASLQQVDSMSFEFEQALRDKCQQNPDLSVLVSQWDYDKRLVTDALQIVGLTFPHYSRHDASHSNTILIQLARVLGQERIKKLSATDIWLLLEAAYQHDIGMVVTTEQAKKWWDSNEFKMFLAMLRMGHERDLREAAEILSDSSRAAVLGPDWPLQVAHARTLVLAEYARRQHPLNAERIVRDPSQIGLMSPRTTLIPRRLFDVLGRICAHHGRSFAQTMLLPFRESGLGTDDAHPRFVACMLRLGDLLDLDNNRFCPIMVRSFGQLPASSLAHFEKHAAVTRLDVNTTLIEVEAECPNYESYEVTEQWFSWLREELKDQMATWSKITPAPDFGALPSVGTISARIIGHIALEPGRRPRFEVDREAMVSLVKGANIYGDRFDCIRELLQNAVDATLIRLWRDEWSNKSKEEIEQFEPKDLRKALEKYPIRIWFERRSEVSSSIGITPDKVRWQVTIEDAGTGISLDDIRHMQRIGGSKKNQSRQSTIQEMPEWMRPSGIFGIGLQSIFLFTDTATLTTRHHDTRETLQIELRNENNKSGMPDGLSIKRIGHTADKGFRIGTRIIFDFDVERIPSWTYETTGVESRRMDREFDPIVHEEMPYEIAHAKDQARHFAEACFCPIEMDGVLLARSDQDSQEFQFDRQSGLEISITAESFHDSEMLLFYRGAPLTELNYIGSRTDLLRIRCDVHTGRADELLLLSRESFTYEGWLKIRASLQEAIARQFPTYINSLKTKHPLNTAELNLASLYARIHGFSTSPNLAPNDWRNITVNSDGLTLAEILRYPVVVVKDCPKKSNDPLKAFDVKSTPISDTQISIETTRRDYPQPNIIRQILQLEMGAPTLTDFEMEDEWTHFVSLTYTYNKNTPGTVLTDTGLRYVLLQCTTLEWLPIRGRKTIPCSSKFKALSYDAEKTHLRRTDAVEGWLQPRMVSPFVGAHRSVQLPHLGKYVEWTARHAAGGPRNPKEVAEVLLAFIQHADDLMKDDWKGLRKYNLIDVERELSSWLRM